MVESEVDIKYIANTIECRQKISGINFPREKFGAQRHIMCYLLVYVTSLTLWAPTYKIDIVSLPLTNPYAYYWRKKNNEPSTSSQVEERGLQKHKL